MVLYVEIGLKWSYFMEDIMLKLSKKTEYAVIAIIDMAANGKSSLTTAKDLSTKYNIPRELLGKVLQSLAREEVIVSQQGVKGGYRLKLPLDKINFNTIIKAVEGPIHLVDCRDESECNCEQARLLQHKKSDGIYSD